MSDSDKPPARGGDFPEETRLRDGPMVEEIVTMAIEALNAQGHPDVTRDSLDGNADHRRLVADMLRDCRPLPAILALIEELESR